MSGAKPENIEVANQFEERLHWRISSLLYSPDIVGPWWGPGLRWYEDAHEFANSLKVYGVTAVQSAGIIAALSPQRHWSINKLAAKEYLESGRRSHTTKNMAKCDRIRNEARDCEDVMGILNGRKTKAFFRCMFDPVGDHAAVAIDEHMCAFAGISSAILSYRYGHTRSIYERYADVVRICAEQLEILPLQLQAIVWCVQRQSTGSSQQFLGS